MSKYTINFIIVENELGLSISKLKPNSSDDLLLLSGNNIKNFYDENVSFKNIYGVLNEYGDTVLIENDKYVNYSAKQIYEKAVLAFKDLLGEVTKAKYISYKRNDDEDSVLENLHKINKKLGIEILPEKGIFNQKKYIELYKNFSLYALSYVNDSDIKNNLTQLKNLMKGINSFLVANDSIEESLVQGNSEVFFTYLDEKENYKVNYSKASSVLNADNYIFINKSNENNNNKKKMI